MNRTLEVVVAPVSDVDRAKAFYAEQLGFNVDHDIRVSDESRIIQPTPPGSGCSIVLGNRIVDMQPGSLEGLRLVVSDINAARDRVLVERGWRSAKSRCWMVNVSPDSWRGDSRQRGVRLLQRSGRQRLGRAADICPRLDNPPEGKRS